MKKINIVLNCFLFATISCGGDAVALNSPWWLQTTICRVNTSQCWPSGAAIDTGMWDADANCWGMKTVCEEATTNGSSDDMISKTKLLAGTGIKSDFDTNSLSVNKDCWGARKTRNSGSEALVGSNYVKVFCNGVLDDSDETVNNGEIITSGSQPNCQNLASNGYVAILNGSCYGKYFKPSNYLIECDGGELPSRIIALNGASDPQYRTSTTPITASAATDIFNAMRAASKAQKSKYFNN